MIAISRLLAIGMSVLAVWAAVDALVRPSRAYEAIGHKKAYWCGGLVAAVVLPWLVGVGFGLVGLVAAIVYLVEYRPKLRDLGGNSSNRW